MHRVAEKFGAPGKEVMRSESGPQISVPTVEGPH